MTKNETNKLLITYRFWSAVYGPLRARLVFVPIPKTYWVITPILFHLGTETKDLSFALRISEESLKTALHLFEWKAKLKSK